jgi:hypothetical protein
MTDEFLTEAEVRERLRESVAEFRSQSAFAREKNVWAPLVCEALSGRYVGTGEFPPSVLAAIGVERRVVYALVERRRVA